MSKSKPQQEPLRLFWRWHNSSESVKRVWRSDWGFDQFELVSNQGFQELEMWFKKFSFPVEEVEEDE